MRSGSFLNRQKGGVLLTMVVGLTLLAVVGASISSQNSSSAMSHLSVVDQTRAYSLAESGLRAALGNPTDFMPPAPGAGSLTGAEVTYTLDASRQFRLQLISGGSEIRSTGVVNLGTPYEATRVIEVPALLEEWEQTGATISDVIETGSNLNWGEADHTIATATDAWNEKDQYLKHSSAHQSEFQDTGSSSSAWSASGKTLSYDVQVKVAWKNNIEYTATGVSFRYHDVTYGKPACLGLSYMRYNVGYDGIPNELKPFNPISGSKMGKWTLLVLWRQDVVSGSIQREWIAAKKLFYLPYKMAPQGEPQSYVQSIGSSWDGILNDNSGLAVRLQEKKDAVSNHLLIKCFFTDANHNYKERTPNDIPWDIKKFRRLYMPSYMYQKYYPVQIFPAFPPLNRWSSPEDYFTYPANTFAWDYVNPAVMAKGYSLQSDGGTFRVTDPRFISPSTGSSLSRPEFALHSFGNLSGKFVVFNDFALRYLRKK